MALVFSQNHLLVKLSHLCSYIISHSATALWWLTHSLTIRV